MKSRYVIAGSALALCLGWAGLAAADEPYVPHAPGAYPITSGWPPRAPRAAWHGGYYDPAWGTPHVILVPPTARLQTNWGWGVANTRVSRIPHQFRRPWPGPFPGNGGFRPVPPWPSDTTQLGAYYVRGPW